MNCSYDVRLVFLWCPSVVLFSCHDAIIILAEYRDRNLSPCPPETARRNQGRLANLRKRQDFAPYTNFVASIMPCRNNSGKISPKFLESGKSRCTFAVANKLQRRVKAAAQQSSNKFGSAFTLHFTCIVNQTKQVLGDANKRINKIIISKN